MGDIISVVVTGAGAPGIAGTIYSLKNNPDNFNFRVITTDIKEDVVGKYLSDLFYRVPPPESPEYMLVLKEIVEKEEVKVIIPQTTREIGVLSKYRKELSELGTEIVVSDHDSIKIANDKYLLLEKAREIEIPCPAYFLVSSEGELTEAVEKLGYPLRKVVVKPRVSNGMRGLRVLSESHWNVERFLNEKPEGMEIDLKNLLAILKDGSFPELLVMEYLEGCEYTVDVFRNISGVVAIPRLREVIRSGITFEASVELREDLTEYSARLSDALNLEYCFGFQFKSSKKGIPKLLECNPRVQGTMVVSTFAGFNMIYCSVKMALGYKVDVSGVRLKEKLDFKRYWGGIAIGDGCVIGGI